MGGGGCGASSDGGLDGGGLGEGGGGDGDGGGGDGDGGLGGGGLGEGVGGGGEGGGGLGEHLGSGSSSMVSPFPHFCLSNFHLHSFSFPLPTSVQALRHSCWLFAAPHFVAPGLKHVPGASGGGDGEDGGGDGDWQHASQQLSESFFPF